MSLKQRLQRLESRAKPARRLVVVDVTPGGTVWSEDGQRHTGELPGDLRPDDLVVRFTTNVNMAAL